MHSSTVTKKGSASVHLSEAVKTGGMLNVPQMKVPTVVISFVVVKLGTLHILYNIGLPPSLISLQIL